MPMLDYQCAACAHRFTELVAMGKEDQVRCEKCGSDQITRVYQGKCLFGSGAARGGKSSCSGKSCSCCSGCR